MSKPYLIVFLGPRGAGKSTQMRLLASALRKKGLKVRIPHIKTGIIFGYLIANFLVKMLVRKRQTKPPIMVLVEEAPCFFRKTFRLWITIDLVVVSVKFLLGIYIPMKLGYFVLIEDYIPSIITDYIYLAKLVSVSFKELTFLWKIMFRLMHLSCPMYKIFLDADINTLNYRRLLRGDLDEYQDYLYTQRTTLKSLSKRILSEEPFLYINTEKCDIREVHERITAYLS